MAALKKSKKQAKSGAGLAFALVFFILLSIGLGYLAYAGYAGQDALRKIAKDKDIEKEGHKIGEEYYRFLALDYALALGYELDGDAKKDYADARKEFLAFHETAEGSGRFKVLSAPTDKRRVFEKKIVDDNAAELGTMNPKTGKREFDDRNLKYELSYRDRIKTYITRADDVEKLAEGRQENFTKATARFDELKKNYDNWWNKVFTEIQDSNKEIIAEAKKMYKQMEDALASADKANKQLVDLQEEKEKGEAKLKKKIKELDDQLKTALSDRPEGGAVGGGGSGGDKEPHALVLDISFDKPLWDRPLGEVTAVDLPNKLVYVRSNRNVDQPFKAGLSFLVFARGADGAASGQLKGSLEVIREIDKNNYACRLSSFYDIDRGEIYLPDPAKVTGIRSSRNAIQPGDLIFNVFFGSRVALAGVFDLDGNPAASPSEQARQLEATIASLRNRGIEVDAYIDPVSGLIKGSITPKTRFLLRSSDIDIAKYVEKEPPMPMEKKEMKEEGKEGAGKGELPEEDRMRNLEQSFRRLKQDAVDKGLFIISRANFISVIGYHPPRHFGETGTIRRVPRLPSATMFATAATSFIAKEDARVPDYVGTWEGGGWEVAIDKDGKAKVNLLIDRGGVPEVRLAPAELTFKDGKYTLSIFGPMPQDMLASISVAGNTIQLEDPTGKMIPPRKVLRKR